MAFSIRFVRISDIFTSSISAVTSLVLTSRSSISLFLAMGRILFKMISASSFILTLVIFSSAADLSIFTSTSRSLMILSSRSISSAISSRNSRYNSAGTSCCARRESASTLTDVIGVFSSWDTFATKSCLELSMFII